MVPLRSQLCHPHLQHHLPNSPTTAAHPTAATVRVGDVSGKENEASASQPPDNGSIMIHGSEDTMIDMAVEENGEVMEEEDQTRTVMEARSPNVQQQQPGCRNVASQGFDDLNKGMCML